MSKSNNIFRYLVKKKNQNILLFISNQLLIF